MEKICHLLFHRGRAVFIIAAGMITLILSAFVLEYGFDAKPCQMCWWQRYMHWALAAVAVLGIVLRHKVRAIVTLGTLYFLAISNALIALWQMLVQRKIVPAPEGCSAAEVRLSTSGSDLLANLKNAKVEVMPPCDQIDFTILSLTLADWNFAIMLGLAIYIVIVIKQKP